MLVFVYSKNAVLNFYSNPADSTPSINIPIIEDADNKQLNLKLSNEQIQWFKPETFWDEEQVLHFVCTSKKGNWYKVVVNSAQKKEFWIPSSTNTHFFKWKNYLSNTALVEVKDTVKNAAHLLPTKLSPKLKSRPYKCLRILKIRGKWAKLEFDQRTCANYNRNSFIAPKTAWVKWRNKENFLINYFLR